MAVIFGKHFDRVLLQVVGYLAAKSGLDQNLLCICECRWHLHGNDRDLGRAPKFCVWHDILYCA